MTSTRIVRITGGSDAMVAFLRDAQEQIERDDDTEIELTVPPNSPDDPALQLELTTVDCEPGEELLVEYLEVGDDD